MTTVKYFILLSLLAACSGTKKGALVSWYNEPYRPQVHFSPEAHWMNDPNGMVYYNGRYHLFYQYNPDSTVWGPMHWGHAISKDLVHWEHLAIALYPDSLGQIFSGSAVADVNNTSGFGKNGKPPLVCIYTSHDAKAEKSGSNTFQTQSIAYSTDDGDTWIKYSGNPVVKNPGIRDFRDPKVSWFGAGKKWIMTLATLDHITFYSSPDLKSWTKESEFGKEFGAHGGVWECPDLFSLDHDGKKIWILVVNLNPGGPNGGSATQYFTGTFDGNKFVPYQTDTTWLDYGPDEYAGITWCNTGDRKIFLGWMSNWQYANVVPTARWRSATTVPRELSIEKAGDRYLVASQPVKELSAIMQPPLSFSGIDATNYDLSKKTGRLKGPATLRITADKIATFSLTLYNAMGEKLLAGYDKNTNTYFIDRTNSGKVDFEKGFAARHTAPRLAEKENLDLTIIIDNASIELFADNGLSVMTAIFFPGEPYSDIRIQSPDHFTINSLAFYKMNSIWR